MTQLALLQPPTEFDPPTHEFCGATYYTCRRGTHHWLERETAEKCCDPAFVYMGPANEWSTKLQFRPAVEGKRR